MALVRVTIRYSLDFDDSGSMRRHVEGRLNEIASWNPLPRNRGSTATMETTMPTTDLARFGVELAKIFENFDPKNGKHGRARLDHFWMHCDVIEQAVGA